MADEYVGFLIDIRGHANISPADAQAVRQKVEELILFCAAAGLPLSGGYVGPPDEPVTRAAAAQDKTPAKVKG